MIIVVILILSITGKVEAEDANNLGLSQAIDLMLKDSLKLEIKKLELDNTKLDYRKSKAENVKQESAISELEAELDLFKAENTYYQARVDLLNEVLTGYFDILLLQEELEIKKKELMLEESSLDKSRAEVRAGYKDKLDLLKQENEYNDALFDLESLYDDYEEKLLNFRLTLGIEDNLAFKLQEWELSEIWEIDKEDVLINAMKNDLSLKLKEIEITLAQKELDMAKRISIPELEFESLRNDLKICQLEEVNLKEELYNLVQSSYFNYQRAVKNIDLNKEDLTEAKEDYQIVKEEVDKGLKTEDELLVAEINLLKAEYNYQSAIADYYLSQLKLKKVMGLKVEVLIDGFKE